MAIDEKHIDDLIAKYLAGEASQEEKLLLQQWMDESPENKKYFGDIQFVYNKAEASRKYIKVDTERAWDKVRSQMKRPIAIDNVSKTKERQLNPWKWMQAAAIFLMILSSAIYVYTTLSRPANQTTVAVTITTKDSTANKALASNTRLFLNKNSTATFTQKNGRRQELTLSGEAYIQYSHNQDTTLIVKADETLIRDIGTSFNVKAYRGNPTIEVYVEEGEVAFYTDTQTGITLKQGETGIYDKSTRTFRKFVKSDVNVLSYKTRKFVFTNKKLAEALAELNSVYNEPITIKNPKLANCSITVTFDNERTSSIVDIMAETLGLKVEKTETGYVLDGELCPSK